MCGTINYTSTILTLLELIAYYIALTFETLFSFESSIYLPFTFVRGITLQFFVLEIYSNVKKNIVGVILSCIFRAIKLGLAIYLWISMVSPQKKWHYFIFMIKSNDTHNMLVLFSGTLIFLMTSFFIICILMSLWKSFMVL